MMWLSGFSYRTNPVLILARFQANSHVGIVVTHDCGLLLAHWIGIDRLSLSEFWPSHVGKS